MSQRIVCYRLEAAVGPRELQLPEGTEVLSATYHQGAVGLWVLLPAGAGPQCPVEVHTFEVVGTGDAIQAPGRYLGTCSAPGGTFCVHVLERPDPERVDLGNRPEALAARIQAVDSLRAQLAEQVVRIEDQLEESVDGIRTRLEALEGSPGCVEEEPS